MDLLKNIFKGDKVIWIIFLCLCLISIIEVFSAASTLTYKSGDHWGPITQHSIILMVGAVVVVLLHNIPTNGSRYFQSSYIRVSVVLLAFRHSDGHHHRRPCQRARALDDLYGFAIPAIGIGKDGGDHCRLIHPVEKGRTKGANPKAFKYIMILTGLVCLLIAPENLSTAMLLFGVVCMMMFIGRVASKKLFGMLGILGL